MHPVLTITEIFRLILEFMDRGTAVVCARVCKTWSDMALDRIWRTISQDDDTLGGLFNPLLVREFVLDLVRWPGWCWSRVLLNLCCNIEQEGNRSCVVEVPLIRKTSADFVP